jgi:glutathione reductase (NADPH)
MTTRIEEFDVFVIGTGTAGETAAAMVQDAGLSVGIADRAEFGGTCALRGCQPKKYLVVPAHAAMEGAGLTERGFTAAPTLDWKAMQRSRSDFTDAVPGGTEDSLREKGIEVFHGECRFRDTGTIECAGRTIRARRFLIATGARPRPLPLPGGELAATSDDFLYLPKLPEHITFIGGGYISMEFATVAAAAGAGVTVLQRGDRVMDRFDPDLVDVLMKSCSLRSIDIRTKVETKSIDNRGEREGGKYVVHIAENGKDGTIETDLVIAALGRIPNIDALNLDAAGVSAGPRGIETDGMMRTSNNTIYAVGDCVAGIQLSPVSDAEARTAARNIVVDLLSPSNTPGTPDSPTGEHEQVDLSTLPTVVFTYPQLAQFGLSEEEARRRGGVTIHHGSGAGWPNYRRLNESHVAYKVMVDDETDRIVGAHILAPLAGELVNLLAIAARQGTTAAEFREIPWAYPTYTSDLKYMLG